jgi:hypothetical protein
METPTVVAKEAGASNAHSAVGLADGGYDASVRHKGWLKLPFRVPRSVSDAGVLVLLDGGPDALASFQSCLESAEEQCRWVTVEERSKSGLRWKRRISLAQAKDSPAGRTCFAKMQRQCNQSLQSAKDEDLRFAKLDAELAPNNIDQPFTAKLLQALSAAGAKNTQVACTKRFCRVRGAVMHPRSWFGASQLLGVHSAASRPDGLYVTRDGYQFPR